MSLTLTLERGGGEVSGSGTQIELEGTGEGYSLESVTMNGDTEQQTYSGKNLFNKDNASYIGGYFEIGGTISTSSSNRNRVIYIPCEANTTYSLTKATGAWSGGAWLLGVCHETPAAGVSVYNAVSVGNSKTYNGYTTDSSSAYLVLRCQNADSITYGWNVQVGDTGLTVWQTILAGLQFEKSATATSYEPYVGGIPSPNPDYPQNVEVVTGEQTITISDGGSESQSYTIDLGDIELCKIGTYQDYIYKSGDDWYIHRAIGKVPISGGSYTWLNGCAQSTSKYPAGRLASSVAISDAFTYNSVQSGITTNLNSGEFGFNTTEYATFKWSGFSSVTDFNTWVSNNNPQIYYILTNPTDTQITNSALIAQLDALSSAQTYDGITYITVSSENLKGSLDVTSEAPIRKTYTEVEIGSPFTIADVEGKSSNTTLDGNVYVDWAYNKKQYSFNLFNLTPQDYADIRAYYDYQFSSGEFPTITVPELDINKLPVYMEISSRNIINQCLLTDKLTIKFRETVQP